MSIKKMYSFLSFLFFLYWPSSLLSQPPFYTYNTTLIKNEQQTNSKGFLLYKGFRGFLWIGSNDGASRYDGRNFKNYNIKDGLTQNYIADIKEDDDWKLYIASPSGISIYTGEPNLPFTPLALPAEVLQITAILPEHINKIWIADEISSTVWLFKNNKINRVEGINEPIYDMVKDKAGIIYALSRQKNLFIIKADRLLYKLSLLEPKILSNNEFDTRLKVDKHGNAFCYSNTLHILSPEKPYLTLYKAPSTDVYYNTSIPIKNKKRILYRSEQAKWLPIAELPAGEKEKSSMYIENNGNILYTSENAGFYILTPKAYTLLSVNKLLSYCMMGDNATKIVKFDSAVYNNKLAIKAYHVIGEKNLLNIFKGKDETIWFCTFNGLYYLINGKGQLKYYSFGLQNKDPNYNLFIDAVEDYAGKTWFRTNNGLVCYDGKKFLHWNSINGLHDNTFFSMAVDGKGKLYAGGNSLYAEINGVPVDISKNIGLKKADILSMSTDKDGNIWICPNADKLYQIKQSNTGAFYKSDSLTLQINELSLAIKSIAFDKVGNLWAAGTNNMIIYLLQPSGKFSDKKIVLSKPQFLEDEKDERMPLNTNQDKTVIYLRNTAFNAAEVIKNFKTEASKLVLTEIMLNHKKTNWWSFTDSVNQYGFPKSVTLKSKENNLSFHFTNISIGDGFFTRYSHKLEGLETDWQPLSNVEVADYTNLSPGNYTFYLKTINQNGQWSAPIKFSFSILAIWYKTTQAIILWGFLLAVLFIGVSKYRVNKINYKTRIDKLLIEQQLKALRAQINPHFIQNSLEFLMQSIEKESPQTIHNIVEQLSLYLRHILSMSDKNIVTLEDELEFSEEYLSINKLLFNRHFTYSIDIDPAIDTFSIKIPAMLLQPFLENALKHGVQFADRERAVIDVKISQKGRFISCKVTNNYLSTISDQALTQKHVPKGLLITQERLSLLYPKEKLSDLIFFKKENNLYIATICIPI